ncbi:transposase-like protein [Clostridium acetobutylicum]|uniref:Zn-finger DNA-binding domain n=1 Tax=Clostridium acetobutylicum (strain ATCC 824 / DSM 792 / JCM 1419 / IAM 19013 / LMG 5710 / NBRC 13948 / NRRL B-527 / VKM B-1787 / 2291 / W) TaxID=272562 RepID=Q97IP3_CLOAB|nr:Zn-finger DNA-binding domain [Clostridium acetobutylicum ATCC 824]ADZ20649.1 Zn-finger DNA-binding domain protein [Clostridium acetobutylicum EA 2018]AEI31884.1 zinc finger domain-containing protein [Clostridium acetobutylicum DSM 1731]AWV79996.1 hypothetical protein DK921_07775 [Clostridium acetobutylicum]PSM07956.1 hypothetical protein C7T89_07770 [Clostridium sp. NJ4]
MSSVSSIINEIETLNIHEQEQLLSFLEDVLNSYASEITEEVRENRFSKGKVYLHCKLEMFSRNGKHDEKQRYVCKTCKKTFTDFTYSPISSSKKPLDKWLQYAKCMIVGYSIRKCAKTVNINIATSFFWRHKILEAIRTFIGVGSVDGVVEADEIFLENLLKVIIKRVHHL